MTTDNREPDYTRLVADSDVLTADLLVGNTARDVLDTVRSHSWLDLVATDPLLDDAEGVIETLTERDLASDWREMIEELVTIVEQPTGDHPALAAAYRGNAMHVISFDSRLQSASAGANLRGAMNVSVRSPEAFVSVFDPRTAYEVTFDTDYPGPDGDPRA